MLGGFEQIFGMAGPRNFSVQLRCYSMLYFGKADATRINSMNYGGNILLPNSALDLLTRLNVQYPLLFKISGLSIEHQRVTHAGVLEFLAEEGKCYLPSWMMRQLSFVEGELASIEYVSLPLATYAKFKPMSTDFLNISNPRAILEVELRKFRCLTKNDVITIAYNDEVLEFKVMDLKPRNAVSITECDVNLEFDAPEGYVEPRRVNEMPEAPEIPPAKSAGWAAFCGEGMRLDGKPRTLSTSSASTANEAVGAGGGPSSGSPASSAKPAAASSTGLSSASGSGGEKEEVVVAGGPPQLADVIPDESYEPGVLKFIRYNYKNRVALQQAIDKKAEESVNSVITTPFSGSALTLRSDLMFPCEQDS